MYIEVVGLHHEDVTLKGPTGFRNGTNSSPDTYVGQFNGSFSSANTMGHSCCYSYFNIMVNYST